MSSDKANSCDISGQTVILLEKNKKERNGLLLKLIDNSNSQ